MAKRETVEEFLARGGEITKVPNPNNTPTTEGNSVGHGNSPSRLMSLSEGGLFFAERKEKKVKDKTTINFDAIGLLSQHAALLRFKH